MPVDCHDDLFGSDATAAKDDRILDDWIENIYQEFPLKVGKRAATKAIRAALMRVTKRMPSSREAYLWILQRTRTFAKSPKGKRKSPQPDPCPHPSTWFNQDRFDDDIYTWGLKRDPYAPVRTLAANDPVEDFRRSWLSMPGLDESRRAHIAAMSRGDVEIALHHSHFFKAVEIYGWANPPEAPVRKAFDQWQEKAGAAGKPPITIEAALEAARDKIRRKRGLA